MKQFGSYDNKTSNFKIKEMKTEPREFKKYRRTQIAEMRPVTEKDIQYFKEEFCIPSGERYDVSISDTDSENGSPRIGDMIARNPKNHDDQWLVAEKYFKDNFEEI